MDGNLSMSFINTNAFILWSSNHISRNMLHMHSHMQKEVCTVIDSGIFCSSRSFGKNLTSINRRLNILCSIHVMKKWKKPLLYWHSRVYCLALERVRCVTILMIHRFSKRVVRGQFFAYRTWFGGKKSNGVGKHFPIYPLMFSEFPSIWLCCVFKLNKLKL